MIIYNITIKIEPGIESDWLQWQKDEHIPDTMATGRFISYKICRLLQQDDEDGITYVIQYTAENMQQYQQYMDAFSASLRDKAFKRWGNRFIAFRTVMEVVH